MKDIYNENITQQNESAQKYPLISQIWHKINYWKEISSQRRELRKLNDHILKDIGLSRADAERESSRPFWDNASNNDVTLRKRGEVIREGILAEIECSICQL